MKKIPTLFQRTDDQRHVVDEVTTGCDWVLRGEGVATRKWDGTCVFVRNEFGMVGAMTRREVKAGKPFPAHFVPVQTDEVTGKTVGWEPYRLSSFARLIEPLLGDYLETGTYELCGPKVNGNPEQLSEHTLFRHGVEGDLRPPLTFSGLRSYLTVEHPEMEGIVWHHEDGRMAKLKRKDFT